MPPRWPQLEIRVIESNLDARDVTECMRSRTDSIICRRMVGEDEGQNEQLGLLCLFEFQHPNSLIVLGVWLHI